MSLRKNKFDTRSRFGHKQLSEKIVVTASKIALFAYNYIFCQGLLSIFFLQFFKISKRRRKNQKSSQNNRYAMLCLLILMVESYFKTQITSAIKSILKDKLKALVLISVIKECLTQTQVSCLHNLRVVYIHILKKSFEFKPNIL